MVQTSQSGGVRTIRLDRPDRRNALTPEMVDALRAAIDGAADCGALLVTGSGPMFCSGFDLAVVEADPSRLALRRLLAGLSAAIRALRALPCPVVAAVQGGAIAGGCALLGGADVVISEPEARFGYPVVRLGISPAVSGRFLARAVGSGPARRLLLDPGLIRASEAARIGLVHILTDTGDGVQDQAIEAAIALAGKPWEGVQATRKWLCAIEDALGGASETGADAGLSESLGLVGGPEERSLMRAARP